MHAIWSVPWCLLWHGTSEWQSRAALLMGLRRTHSYSSTLPWVELLTLRSRPWSVLEYYVFFAWLGRRHDNDKSTSSMLISYSLRLKHWELSQNTKGKVPNSPPPLRSRHGKRGTDLRLRLVCSTYTGRSIFALFQAAIAGSGEGRLKKSVFARGKVPIARVQEPDCSLHISRSD